MLTKIYFIIFTILMIVDGITTYKIMSDGGYELNPIVSTFIKYLGVSLGLIIIKLLVLIFIYWLNPPDYAYVLLILLYIYVCSHNIKQLA